MKNHNNKIFLEHHKILFKNKKPYYKAFYEIIFIFLKKQYNLHKYFLNYLYVTKAR